MLHGQDFFFYYFPGSCVNDAIFLPPSSLPYLPREHPPSISIQSKAGEVPTANRPAKKNGLSSSSSAYNMPAPSPSSYIKPSVPAMKTGGSGVSRTGKGAVPSTASLRSSGHKLW